MKNIFILILVLLLIWLPVCFDKYDYSTALIIMFSTIIGGYVGGKFLKKK